jgi:hypothetical protein
VRQDAGTCGIEMLVLGSSNFIGGGSYVEKTCAKLHGRLTNLSVGACSSTLGLYQLHKIEPVCGGLAFIDFAINDNDAAWNLWGKYNAQSTIAENIGTVAARLRSLKYFPILVISASLLDEECEPYGNVLHRDICERERITFVDIRALMLQAIKRGASRDALMRDDYHMSDRSSDAVASCLAALVRHINGTSATFVPQSNSIVRTYVDGGHLGKANERLRARNDVMCVDDVGFFRKPAQVIDHCHTQSP